VLFITPLAFTASSKQVLTQNDFNYVGAFLMPAEKSWQYGLTHRYVNGELRMFAGGDDVTEVRVPALSTGGSFQTAQIVKEWGDITGGKPSTASGNYKVYGIYWDETDKRLYWTYGDDYN